MLIVNKIVNDILKNEEDQGLNDQKTYLQFKQNYQVISSNDFCSGLYAINFYILRVRNLKEIKHISIFFNLYLVMSCRIGEIILDTNFIMAQIKVMRICFIVWYYRSHRAVDGILCKKWYEHLTTPFCFQSAENSHKSKDITF